MTVTPLPPGPEYPCPFCDIVAGRAPAEIFHEWSDTLAIVPLNPVTDGHILVLPKIHVADVGHDPEISATTMRRAAQLAASGWCNIITSRGRVATQTVFHLHYHLVPRREGDGLALPWDDGRSRAGSVDITVHQDPPHIADEIRDVRRWGISRRSRRA